MHIKKTIDKIPGGLMICPLLLGTVINTFFPTFGKTLGSYTFAMMTGALPIIAVFFFCLGATIDVKMTPYILKKGAALLATKWICGVVACLIVSHFIPTDAVVKAGFFTGLSVLAVVCSINDTNGGLYMALLGQYGRYEDAAAYSVMCIEGGPFLTMLTLGLTGLAAFPLTSFVGTILPLMLGVLLGNLDPDMRTFLTPGATLLIPFFAFTLGNALSLKMVFQSGLLGICLGVAVVVFTGTFLILSDRLTGGTGVCGVAAAATAGVSASVPISIAAINKSFVPLVPSATALTATSILVTALLVPLVTSWYAKRWGVTREAKPKKAMRQGA
jgi:2-keto-3-deoxygluconate permease